MNDTTTFPTTTASATTMGPTGNGVTPTGSRERIHRFAGWMHQAIDKVEHGLGSKVQDGTAVQAKYVGQAQEYGNKLRQRFNERPVQSAGLALATGAVLHKLMASKPKAQVRVVKVPVYRRAPAVSPASAAWTAQLAGKAGAVAGMGIGSTKAAASSLANTASALPSQLRLATQRLLTRSQEYGSVAKSGVQAHPIVGIGSMLGAGALVTTLLMQRRRPAMTSPYATLDEKGTGLAGQRERSLQSGVMDTVASRPVASAAVMLGVGALVGALLRRH